MKTDPNAKEKKLARIKRYKRKTLLKKIKNTTKQVLTTVGFFFVSNLFGNSGQVSQAAENKDAGKDLHSAIKKLDSSNFSLLSGTAEINKDSDICSVFEQQGLSSELTDEFKKAFSPMVEFDGNTSGFDYEILKNDQTGQISRATIKYNLKATTNKNNLKMMKTDREITVYGYTDNDGQHRYYTEDGQNIENSLRLPLNNKDINITSPFSPRRTVMGVTRKHDGIDFGVKPGTRIHSSASGVIKEIGFDAKGYGNYMIIDHGKDAQGNEILTYYGHLSKTSAAMKIGKEGDTVKKGQLIALSGNTGRSTGPHLHYEVRINNDAIDPLTAQIYFGEKRDDKSFELMVAGINAVNKELSNTYRPAITAFAAPDDVFIKDKTKAVKGKLAQAKSNADNDKRTTAKTKKANIALQQSQNNNSRA